MTYDEAKRLVIELKQFTDKKGYDYDCEIFRKENEI